MSGVTWTTWVWWLGGGGLLIISLTLLFWALLWDRARGRKRCPRCWYDMSAATTLTCSECGKTVKRPRKLLKTRRHKRWALVALLGVVASGYLAMQPRVRDRGWWSLVPSNVLIAGLPLARDVDNFWCHELGCRIVAGTGIGVVKYQPADGKRRETLTQEEWAQFFDACVEGDWRARPVTEAWQRKYGALLDLWLEHSFHMPNEGGKAEEHRLVALPVAISFATRGLWPVDAEPYVACQFRCWWPQRPARRAIVTLRDSERDPVTVGGRAPYPMLLPEFGDPERVFTFDVVFERSDDPADKESWTEFDRTSKSITMRRHGKISDQLTPFDQGALTEHMAAGVSYTITRRQGRIGAMMLDSRVCQSAIYRGVAFGFQIDFMRDGEVIATLPYWLRGGDVERFSFGDMGAAIRRLIDEIDKEGNWEARFRSDPELALRVLDATTFWEGEFTIPLIIQDAAWQPTPPSPRPQQPNP
jgi:hypothetical protein